VAGIVAGSAYYGQRYVVDTGCGGVCVGLGLMQRAPWARTAAIVLGVLALFHPSFGTASGVYSLWVLLGDEGADVGCTLGLRHRVKGVVAVR
jgi:hypothetical protein